MQRINNLYSGIAIAISLSAQHIFSKPSPKFSLRCPVTRISRLSGDPARGRWTPQGDVVDLLINLSPRPKAVSLLANSPVSSEFEGTIYTLSQSSLTLKKQQIAVSRELLAFIS
jgi:hypothetical protein